MTYPLGLSKETRFAITSAGKCALHMVGCAAAGSVDCREALGCQFRERGMNMGPGIHAPPPHMYLEASWFTVRVGVRVTSLGMRMGRDEKSSASQRKSARALWTTLISVYLLSLTW